jgi:hypothetical protein
MKLDVVFSPQKQIVLCRFIGDFAMKITGFLLELLRSGGQALTSRILCSAVQWGKPMPAFSGMQKAAGQRTAKSPEDTGLLTCLARQLIGISTNI